MQKTLRNLFFVILFSLSLGQFASLTGNILTKFYLFDALIALYVVIGSLYLVRVKQPFEIPKFLIGFFFFTIIAAISLIPVFDRYSAVALMSSLAYLLRWAFYLMSAVTTFNLLRQKILSYFDILSGFVWSAFFIAISGFLQLIILPDFTVLDPSLGWDPHKNRLASTFFDPNFAGGYLTLVITTLLFKKDILLLKLKYYRPILLTLIIALFLTYSRSAWGMFGIIIFFYGLKKNVWLILSAFLLAFSAYFAIPRIQTRVAGITDPADSAYFRVISWKETLRIYDDNKFLGVGFNALKQAKIESGYIASDVKSDHSASGADSSFLLVLATTGVLGFVLFVTSYFLPLVAKPDFFKLALILGLFLQTQFINALFFPQIMFLWLIIFSLFCI